MIHAKPEEREKLEREAGFLARALDAGGLPPSTREVLVVRLRDTRAALHRLDNSDATP